MHRGIGRYSLALAQAMARNNVGHDLRIVLNERFPASVTGLRRAFDGLVPASSIMTFATPAPSAEASPDNMWRLLAAERIREHYLAGLQPDIVHVASLFEGLSDDAVVSVLHGRDRFASAVTLYDLIPLMRQDRYLGDPNIARWYHRKLESLKNAQLLLAISGSARAEAISELHMAPDAVVNISSAVDDIFRPLDLAPDARAALLRRFGLTRSFIMYTGGIDYRKNIEGLIEAYARLPAPLRAQYQLAVVCSVQDADRQRLQRLAAGCDLPAGDLVLTGYVSDDDLVALYNCTSLFVFPSLHEGFGLPALEAMACGAPVIGSNSSSIPEVIGRTDALFDPHSIDDISAAIAAVLNDPARQADLRAHGLVQATRFSWDASARRAIAAFEETHQRRQAARRTSVAVGAPPAPRPRLAFVSPLPPERSGIADCSADLLPELANYYDIELVLAQDQMDDPNLRDRFPQRSADWFEQHAHEFDRIVYQFGNSTFHAHMFGLLERHPGIVVLHDFFLSGVLNHEEGNSPLPNHYCRMLYQSHGYHALAEEKRLGRAASCHTYPCNKSVLDHAVGVIAHSMYSIELAQRWYGPDLAGKFRFLPLQRPLPPVVDKAAARRELGVAEDDILICSFGILAATKRNDDIVESWIDSAAGRDPRCHLVFVGEVGNDAFGIELRQRIAAHPRIRITGYVSEASYNTYLAAADGAIQLRRGSRGETSGSVLDCLSYGLPTIVNAHGSAVEMPATVCLQIADDFSIAELVTALDALRVDRGLRERLSAAARVHVEARTPARVSLLYQEAIEAFTCARARNDERRLVCGIATIGAAGGSDLMQAAAAVAANRTRRGPHQLLVDVTRLAASGTGAASAQRAAIAVLMEAAPVGWRVEPVRYDGKCYRYARRFTLDLIGRADLLIEDAVADASVGDIVLALGPETATTLPAAWQARGVKLEHYEAATGTVQVAQILARLAPVPAARQA
ncbi:glycosyltransferase [Massilia jejuensis]|uniref:Glycosyltransferase n=1 Tax=Massilia jejuensis TaxID=648894 RepID=A0ABW0PHA0_9BURK